MIEYKKVWRTSLKAINYKTHKLRLISDWVNRSNSMKMNSLGYNITEPEETHRDKSLMLPKIISVLSSQPSFDKNQMFDEISISENDFNQLTFDSLAKVDIPKKNLNCILLNNNYAGHDQHNFLWIVMEIQRTLIYFITYYI